MTGDPRKVIGPVYDYASRLIELFADDVELSDVSYNTMGQVTQLKVTEGTYEIVEEYGYDAQTGLLTSQYVYQTGLFREIMSLEYGYSRGNSKGTLNGKTGQLTKVTNHLDHNKDRVYEHDALGRLVKAKGGAAAGATSVVANWTQEYSYDRYGNKTGATKTGVDKYNNAAPLDGLPSVSYNTTSNRINATGWEYDMSGNLIRGQNENGVWQKFEYDAAGRLVKIKDDSNNILETYTYGASRNRLINENTTHRTYYAWDGSSPLVEYVEPVASSTPTYIKAYVYAGTRLLATSGPGGTRIHHSDRLGTGAISTPSVDDYAENSALPFGTALAGETDGSINRIFTSYDRSGETGLDYAMNRIYSPGQSRFTQVDPLGIGTMVRTNPQSLNLYAYVQNKPVDYVDPTGLYEACVHQAMTMMIGRFAGLNSETADRIAYYTGDGKGAADSSEFAATSPSNILKCSQGEGPSVTMHFPSAAQLEENIRAYQGYVDQGNYQQAGFVIHSIQDSLGAHNGFTNDHCKGHATAGTKPDRIIGDKKFIAAANRVLQVMSGKSNARLTTHQINAIVKYIGAQCSDKYWYPKLELHYTLEGGAGGTIGGMDGGGYRGGYPSWWLEMQRFTDWINSIEVGGGSVTVEACVNDECPNA